MSEPIVIVGAGGLGREFVDVVEAINAASDAPVWRLVGVLDDAPAPVNLGRLARRNVTYAGSTTDLGALPAGCKYVIGIGSPSVRRLLARRLDDAGLEAAILVHPSATYGADCEFARGTVLCAGVRVTTNIQLGGHTHLNLNATVGHDSSLGAFVSLNPLSSVSGDCIIGDGVMVGVGAVVLQGLTVGADATVGGSACVVKDVPPETTVKGVPARAAGLSQ